MGLTAFDDGDILIATELHRAVRSLLFTLGLACFLLLVWIAVSQYSVDQLTNEKSGSAKEALLRAEEYLPASARVQARLAEVTALSNLSEAESHARRAVSLSSDNYKYWLTLAAIKAKQGDIEAAEASLRQATDLAPYNSAVRFSLARLLGEQGRAAEAIAEFRRGTLNDYLSHAAVLDFVWQLSKGNVNSVEAATNDDPRAQLILAEFLLNQSRAAEAARVFGQIKDRSLLDSSRGAGFLNNLISGGHLKVAYDLWVQLIGSGNTPLIWNGSFEEDTFRNFTHFDWIIGTSDYAGLAIDPSTGHSSNRSLRIDFRGRAHTILNDEVRQLLLLQPGARYRFQCFAKTEGLITSEGPRIVLANVLASNWLAASAPITQGTNDWQPLSADFIAPHVGAAEVIPVIISIKRTAAASNYEPMRGTVWLDDFTLTKFDNGK